MKLFFFIIGFFNLVFSQNLVFSNSQNTITFRENELIKINGQKYRYLGAGQNDTQIKALKLPSFTIGNIKKKEKVIIDTRDISSFQKYKRFTSTNVLKASYTGFICGTVIYAPMAFYFGYTEGTLNPLNWGFGNDVSDDEKFADGVKYGLIGGVIGGMALIPYSAVFGFITLGEYKLNYIYDYKVKFDYSS